MDKPSTLKQLYDLSAPYAAPIFGAFIALARFWKNHTKEIDEKFKSIQIDVAVLKERSEDSGKTIDRILSEIQKIRQDVQEERKQFVDICGNKFSEYDRKIAMIINRKKRKRT